MCWHWLNFTLLIWQLTATSRLLLASTISSLQHILFIARTCTTHEVLRLDILSVVKAVLFFSPWCLISKTYIISQIKHIFDMLRLVLRICARLLHALELILMRYLDWPCSIEEL